MKYASQYLLSAQTIIDSYDGTVPLAAFLKNYFANNKKFGSKDRKHITHLCFSFYRLGHAAKFVSVASAIKKALYLSGNTQEWEELFIENEPLPSIDSNLVFPFMHSLSDAIDKEKFINNHFIQPDVFLRVRPGKQEKVMGELQQAGIGFHAMGTHTLAVAAGTKLDHVAQLNQDYVIQDYSSQQIGELMNMVKEERYKAKGENNPSTLHPKPHPSIWDCCAASGGKSILAKDIFGEINLTVSDIRESILQNLKKRFREAGILHYKSSICDLSKKIDSRLKIEDYDLVICDAPCTGSGTWARTPEQLYFFKDETINQFQALQRKIILNTIDAVTKGGYYLYITCSAFKKENEEQVAFILESGAFTLVEQKFFHGYLQHADSMFGALFQKKLI